jgi:hypothetical protein
MNCKDQPFTLDALGWPSETMVACDPSKPTPGELMEGDGIDVTCLNDKRRKYLMPSGKVIDD